MNGYVYIEYPKCMYQKDGTTLTVENGEEEESAAQMGWMTAEQYYNPAPPAPPAPPEGEEGYKPEGEDSSVDEPEDVDATDESDAL